jgi:hypothetical protein
MNRRPSRFRPCLEALEERSLLSVSVSLIPAAGGAEKLVINAMSSTVNDTIRIYNNGNGHISGFISDETGDSPLGGGKGFVNVNDVTVYGGPVGAAVYYFQQGDALSPQGDQIYGGGTNLGFSFTTVFEGGNNTLAVDLHGHALKAGPVEFWCFGSPGSDVMTVNATNVNIGPLVLFEVLVDGNKWGTGAGAINFSMTYSGVNSGVLQVHGSADADTQVNFGLNATFLGAPPPRFTIPGHRGTAAFGTRPGDLAFSGGDGNNNLDMLLFSPDGLSLTGDVYPGPGINSCFRTANVKDHGCQFDRVFVPLGRIVPHHVLPGF